MASKKRKLPAICTEETPKTNKINKVDAKQLHVQVSLKTVVQDVNFSVLAFKSSLNYHLQKLNEIQVAEDDAYLNKFRKNISDTISEKLAVLYEMDTRFSLLLTSPFDSDAAELTDDEDESGNEQAFKSIDSILKDLEKIKAKVVVFRGTKEDKKFLHLDELLIRNQIKLDNVESFGNDKIKQKRKIAIQFAQSCQTLLNSKTED